MIALTAWRKLNRLSQRKAVAVLGNTISILLSPASGVGKKTSVPQPTYCRDTEKFLSDHPTVERPKKSTKIPPDKSVNETAPYSLVSFAVLAPTNSFLDVFEANLPFASCWDLLAPSRDLHGLN